MVGASDVLKTGSGAVRGVAAADVYLDSIPKIISEVRLEDTGGIFLVDTWINTIIGHWDQAVTGQKLDELKEGMYVYASQQIREGKTGLTLHDSTYIQAERVPGSDWTDVANVSRAEVLHELQELTVSMLLVAALNLFNKGLEFCEVCQYTKKRKLLMIFFGREPGIWPDRSFYEAEGNYHWRRRGGPYGSNRGSGRRRRDHAFGAHAPRGEKAFGDRERKV